MNIVSKNCLGARRDAGQFRPVHHVHAHRRRPDETSARASCRWSLRASSPGCACSRRAVRVPRRRQRAAAARVDPLLLPRPRVDRRARAGRAQRRHGQLRRSRRSSSSSYRVVRNEVDEEERRVRLPGGEAVQQGAGRTDHRLRAALARGVRLARPARARATAKSSTSPTTRSIPESRPAPAQAAAHGAAGARGAARAVRRRPAVVHIEEPRQGIQFGVRLDPDRAGQSVPGERHRARRDDRRERESRARRRRCRSGRARPACSISRVSTRRSSTSPTRTSATPTVDAAEFALEMLRFPYRQVFGDPNAGGPTPIGLVFKPTDRDVRAESRRSRRCWSLSPKFDPAQIAKAVSRRAGPRSCAPAWTPRRSRRGTRPRRARPACSCPIDVQALYVAAGRRADGADPAVADRARRPAARAAAARAHARPPRPRACTCTGRVPDALLRGTLGDHGDTNRLALPALPDRWLVLRLLVPKGATQAVATRLGASTPTPRQAVAARRTIRPAPLPRRQAGRTVAARGADGHRRRLAAVGRRVRRGDQPPRVPSIRSTTSPRSRRTASRATRSLLVAGWWSTPSSIRSTGAHDVTSLHAPARPRLGARRRSSKAATSSTRRTSSRGRNSDSLGLPTGDALRDAADARRERCAAPVSTIDAAISDG